ncbi:MAG: L-fucose/L-arabinose isomerase family protein [Christensenellales bacterium]
MSTFGVIVSNRSFFPDHLVGSGRTEILALLERLGHSAVILDESATPLGAVESIADGKKCAELFNAHSEIEGVIVCLPNFGNEVGVSTAIRYMDRKVPVLVQACDDDLDKMDLVNRRDAFCGKLSLCSVLRQNGIKYTLTKLHTCPINSIVFARDVERFAKICSVVKGLSRATVGLVGARVDPFHTVRYSEKLLQLSGIHTAVTDFSMILAAVKALDDGDAAVKEAMDELESKATICEGVTMEQRIKQAKFTVALRNWVKENECDAAAIQCWDSLELNFGCASCASMSLLGDEGIPCACETDVTGAVSMLALQLAAGSAPGLMDWDNNYGDDRDKCVNVHCANYPSEFFGSEMEVGCLDILGTTLGSENCFGALKGRVAPGDMTYLKISTDDANGVIRGYVGEGEFTDDPLDSFGGVAVCHVKNLQGLMHFLAEEGFEHHVAMVRGLYAGLLKEALEKYMGWKITRFE